MLIACSIEGLDDDELGCVNERSYASSPMDVDSRDQRFAVPPPW